MIRPLTLISGIALAALTLAVAPATSYIATSPLAAVAFAVAVIALATAAALSPSPAAAALAAAAAVAPAFSIWAATPALGPAARALTDALAPLAGTLILALAIVAAGVAARRLLTALAAEAAIVSATRVLLRDPFYDIHCFANCVASPLVVQRATGVVDAVQALGGPLLVLLAIATAVRLRGRARDALGPGLLAGAIAVRTIALAIEPQEAAPRPALMLAYCLAAASGATVGLVISADAAAAFVARRAALRLLSDLRAGADRGQIETALRLAARDPELAVLDGTPTSPGCAILPVTAGDQEIARIAHQPRARRPLERALGASVKLALANALLREQLEARIEQLNASRERVVSLSDATRRSLERDLHDGAQQGVLAVLFELRLEASLAVDAARRATLEHAADETADVLDELRGLAHGIHPAILTDAGLRAALHALAATAPIRVNVSGAPDGRYPATVEATVYRLVEEAVYNAAEHAEDPVVISIAERPATLLVTVSAGHLGDLATLTDRVELCGGTVSLDATTITAEIPCG